MPKISGEHITAVKAATQRQQTRFRIIAYNAYRKSSKSCRGIFLEDFYAAVCS